ncbi:MAG: TIGR04282 family arsenosugar biosynthesis glycosyltransferase [Verrucomicrobiota bacterium]
MIAALFLKEPVPGKVKTRLAAAIGNEAACQAYRNLVERQLKEIPTSWKIYVFFDPPERSHSVQEWLKGHRVEAFVAQDGNDLGERQMHAIQNINGSSPLFLIGGDCPYLIQDRLLEASQYLETHDLSLIPATDGGYVSLGIKKEHHGLFDNIQWSTSTVRSELAKNCRTLNLTLREATPLTDIDTLKEWKLACKDFPELENNV